MMIISTGGVGALVLLLYLQRVTKTTKPSTPSPTTNTTTTDPHASLPVIGKRVGGTAGREMEERD